MLFRSHQDQLESALTYLLDCGVKTIGLKLGKDGCLVVTAQNRARLPGFVVKTVDSTGAGDAFSAAMIYGRLYGLRLEVRALLANTLGALTTTVWGAGAALQPMEFVRAFLHQQKTGDPVWDGLVDETLNALEASPLQSGGV